MANDEEIQDINPKDAAQHLRDTFIQFIKSELPKPWQQQNEAEQSRSITRIEYMVQRAVFEVCQAIMTVDTRCIPAKLGKLKTDKDGNALVDVKFGALEDDQKLGIWDHLGANVTIVLMDANDYNNFRSKVDIVRDEPALPLADQETPQPEWNEVSKVLNKAEQPQTIAQANKTAAPIMQDPFEEDIGSPAMKLSNGSVVAREAPDAGEAVDDDEVETADSDLVDDDEELASTVNLPNPTKPQPAAPKVTGPRKR